MTIEDPVEYNLHGINQIQVHEEIGLTFSNALRAFLRQAPNIILVGEIRDLETAEIAVRSSLTGHLVFSTLHTNDAPSAVTRLLDMGVEPFLIAATVEAVIGQRLVRMICTNCKEEYEPTDDMLMQLNLSREDVREKRFFYGKGCDNCNNTGYKGRSAVFEIMTMTDRIRELLQQRASTSAIRQIAREQGMRTMRENGLLKIYDGTTTIEEVVRETLLAG
jgi:type IV pilus assembly protein PilB